MKGELITWNLLELNKIRQEINNKAREAVVIK